MYNKDTFARTDKRSALILVAAALGALLFTLTLAGGTPPARAQGDSQADAPCGIKRFWTTKGNCGTTAGTNFLGTTDNQSLVFKTNGTERMRIDTNGNLAIGAASGSAKTEIVVPNEGDLALRLRSGPNSYLDIRPTNTGGRFQTVLDTFNNRDIVLLPHIGNVGIGTTSPQSALQVVGNYIQFPTITGAPPPAGDCNTASQAGRVVVRTDGTTNLYICTGAAWVGK